MIWAEWSSMLKVSMKKILYMSKTHWMIQYRVYLKMINSNKKKNSKIQEYKLK